MPSAPRLKAKPWRRAFKRSASRAGKAAWHAARQTQQSLRGAQASAERNHSATVDEENRYFCTGLGFIPATAPYQKCCDGAMAIRRR